ncbi:hypothetical protein ACH5RR_025697 [Cinchona calisaya]|uniref:Uncharacterized protein n=1 Tax=Cinchona calisaya TaxID=153742 RepID=A0ABD2Z3R6_9GENT
MSALEELKDEFEPSFDAEKGFSSGSKLDPSDSYLDQGYCLLKDNTKWEAAAQARPKLKEVHVQKEPGCSLAV